jgi:hypothetical protein
MNLSLRSLSRMAKTARSRAEREKMRAQIQADLDEVEGRMSKNVKGIQKEVGDIADDVVRTTNAVPTETLHAVNKGTEAAGRAARSGARALKDPKVLAGLGGVLGAGALAARSLPSSSEPGAPPKRPSPKKPSGLVGKAKAGLGRAVQMAKKNPVAAGLAGLGTLAGGAGLMSLGGGESR